MYFNKSQIINDLKSFNNVFDKTSKYSHYSGSNRFGDAYVSLSFSKELQDYLTNLYETEIATEEDRDVKIAKRDELEAILKDYFKKYCLQVLSDNLDNIKSKAVKNYVKDKDIYIRLSISLDYSDIGGLMLGLPTTKANKTMLDEIYNILTNNVITLDKIKVSEALSNKITSFESFGSGWLFDEIISGIESNISINDINFSKFSWSKGYTINIQHIGILDPLFGNPESINYWLEDVDLCAYLIKNVYNKEQDYINYIKEVYYVTDFGKDESNLSFIDALEIGFETEGVINFMENNNIVNGNALCGIVDEEYFKELALQAGYDLSDDSIDIILLG